MKYKPVLNHQSRAAFQNGWWCSYNALLATSAKRAFLCKAVYYNGRRSLSNRQEVPLILLSNQETTELTVTVYSQVEEALINASNLFESWKRIQQTVSSPKNQELLWTADELNSTLEAIEQDIEDLEEALQAAQYNPSQFNLTAKDLNARKKFLDTSRNSIQNIRNTLANPPSKKQYSPNQVSNVELKGKSISKLIGSVCEIVK